MKLTFNSKYLSIDQFNEVDLPDFVVLTGINGSGKSHLLEAIENKSVFINNKKSVKAVLFDYKSFYLENEVVNNVHQIITERNNAWNFFQNNWKNQIGVFRNSLGENYNNLIKISTEKDKCFLCLMEDEVTDQTVFQQYDNYRESLKSLIDQEGFRNNQQALAVSTIINKLSYSIDEITKEDFDDIFKPYQFKNDFLPRHIGSVMWDYYTKYRSNEVNEFQNEKHDKHLPFLSEEKFIKIHGEKPWEVINKILDNFGSIEYRLPSPEGSDYFGDFQLRLKHQNKNLEIEFSALSSGEKVLMALIASIYKTSSDNHFPDILLLDEIDASLHPSMIKNLLNAIDDIFLKRGIKVILVSHSPTTIAIAPEESIYVMNKEGENRIEKKDRNSALTILTEGFATLEEGLRIFNEISKQDISIISEGRNVDFIKKALELNNVNDVEVVVGVEDGSGSHQLNTIFHFLTKINHSKKVIIAWDPEISNSHESVNNTYPFIFPKNMSNNLAKKGIENLFDGNLFNDFITTTKDSKGVERKTFDTNRKKDFAQYVIERNNKDDFKNFDSLINKINEIKK